MKRIALVLVVIAAFALYSRFSSLKTKIDGNDFYYADFLGFVYTKHSSCGFIGPCTYSYKPIWGVNSFNFHPLKYTLGECLDAYAKTNNAVYFFGEKQPQVKDPATFEFAGNNYAKDSQAVYRLCGINLVKKLSPLDFQTVGPICVKSSAVVYCANHEITEADPSSFTHFWRGFYKDKNHVYYLGTTLEGIDPATFETISWGYIKDAYNIFYFDENNKILTKLENVDFKTFEVQTNGFAKDAKQDYLNGIVQPRGELTENNSYLACGCGCCGGKDPLVECIYKKNGDTIMEKRQEDLLQAQSPYCPNMGCSIGTLYKYCD